MEELDPALIREMRDMARKGASVSFMLKELLRGLAPARPHKVTVLRYLREAFALSLQQAKPIAGWAADGSGELQDSELDKLVMSEILKNRQQWDSLDMAPSA